MDRILTVDRSYRFRALPRVRIPFYTVSRVARHVLQFDGYLSGDILTLKSSAVDVECRAMKNFSIVNIHAAYAVIRKGQSVLGYQALYADTSRFPHSEVMCYQPCARPRECGHPCLEPCHAICRCICSNDRDRVLRAAENVPVAPVQQAIVARSRSPSRGPIQPVLHSRPPQSQLSNTDTRQSVKAFQRFSKGGHVEADKKAIQAAKKEAEAVVATDAEALQKLKIADEEMAAALFAENYQDTTPKTSPQKNRDPELIRTSADGKRHEWQTTYIYGGRGDPQMSLLDMD